MHTPAPPALRHVMSVRFRTSRTVSPGHPEGDRYLLQVEGGTFRVHDRDGSRGSSVEGVVRHGSDWVVQRQDDSLELDVRVHLEAADGTVVLMTYSGSSVQGVVRAAPRFSAPMASSLAWLNALVCVAEGAVGPDGVSYEVWAV